MVSTCRSPTARLDGSTEQREGPRRVRGDATVTLCTMYNTHRFTSSHSGNCDRLSGEFDKVKARELKQWPDEIYPGGC